MFSERDAERIGHALFLLSSHPADVGRLILALSTLLESDSGLSADEIAEQLIEPLGGSREAISALLELVSRAPARRCAAGEVILREGAHSDSLMVLTEGQARVERHGVGLLATLDVGDTFGEVALLGRTRRTATVVALSPARVLVVDRRDIEKLSTCFPPLEAHLRTKYRDRLLLQLLAPDSCFGALAVDVRERLFGCLLPGSVGPGTVILEQGQVGNGLFIIVSGRVAVWRRQIGSERIDLATLGPGQYFGEISLLYDTPVTANAEAASAVTFYLLRKPEFDALLFLHHEPLMELFETARRRLG